MVERQYLLLASSQVGKPLRDELYHLLADDPLLSGRVRKADFEGMDYADDMLNVTARRSDVLQQLAPKSDVFLITYVQTHYEKNPVLHVLDEWTNDIADLLPLWRSGQMENKDFEERVKKMFRDFSRGHELLRSYVRKNTEIRGSIFGSIKHVFSMFDTFQPKSPRHAQDIRELTRKALHATLDEMVYRRGPSKQQQEFCLMADELSHVYKARRLSAVIPFLDGRSDGKSSVIREENDGTENDEKITIQEKVLSEFYAREYQWLGIKNIFTICAHSYYQKSAYEQRGIAFHDLVDDEPFIRRIIAIYEKRCNSAQYPQGMVVVSPDKGGMDRAVAFARSLLQHTQRAKLPYDGLVIVMNKSRIRPNVIEDMVPAGLYQCNGTAFQELPLDAAALYRLGYAFFVTRDDITDTFGTGKRSMRVLMEKYGAETIHCAEHGVFSRPALDNIAEARSSGGLNEIMCWDTVPQPSLHSRYGIHCITQTAKTLAAAIREAHLKYVEGMQREDQTASGKDMLTT